jgi:ABC-2 type transport system permease protein
MKRASFGRQLGLLARRSIVRTFRDPGSIAPAVLVPLILFVLVSAGLEKATHVKGFPTTTIWTFTLTIAFANGAMVTVANTGQAIATDIEGGFINRLALTPMRSFALIASQLAGPLVLGVVQALVFLGVGLAAGARFEAGPLGAVVLILIFLSAVLAFGAFGIFVGLRTGSGQAVQSIAPLMTVFLFLSSVNWPRNLITANWFYWVATINPLSYLVEGMRSVLITGWDTKAIGLALAFTGGVLVVMLIASAWSLQGRLVRT